MALKKTSEYGFVFPRSGRPPGALLADFDFDGAILKRDHKLWLDENIVEPANAKRFTPGGWRIDLIGRASKVGSDAHDLWLSDQRMRAVQSYLGLKLAGVPFMFVPSALGESSPFDSSEFDHELDRSVEVRATFAPMKLPKRIKPHLLIPKIHIWKPRPNRKVMDFKLQVLKAKIFVFTLDVKLGPARVGNGTAKVQILINIRELGSSDHALYEFTGAGPGTIIGAGISLKKAIPGLGASTWSATYEKGDPHSFATDVEMDAQDFAGPAAFRFDLLGRTLAFGPKRSFFGSRETIKNLSFGHTADVNLMEYAEATAGGKMTIVESVPSWAT